MSENDKVLFSVDDMIGYITLNRPEKHNALNQEIWDGLDRAMAKALDQDDLRVIILHGAGKSFCSGLDLSPGNSLFLDMTDGPSARNTTLLYHHIRRLQDIFSLLEKTSIPVIGAIHGHCIGGGLELALTCDIRLCSEDSIFSIPEVKFGIIADLGGTQRLPRIVGQGMARELIYTARRFDADEARGMGLVNHVYPDREALMEEAQSMAREIAQNAPLAVQGAKDVINYSANCTVEDGLRYVSSRSSGILLSEDTLESFRAYVEKRRPNFKGT